MCVSGLILRLRERWSAKNTNGKNCKEEVDFVFHISNFE